MQGRKVSECSGEGRKRMSMDKRGCERENKAMRE
jgi:hypothetical protein